MNQRSKLALIVLKLKAYRGLDSPIFLSWIGLTPRGSVLGLLKEGGGDDHRIEEKV